MKKMQAMFLAILFAFTLTACSTQDTPVNESSSDPTHSESVMDQAEEPAQDGEPDDSEAAAGQELSELVQQSTASGTIAMPEGFPSNEGDAIFFAPQSEDYCMWLSEYEKVTVVRMYCYESGEEPGDPPIYAVAKYIYEDTTAAQEVMLGIIRGEVAMENLDSEDVCEWVDNVIFHVYSDPSRGSGRPNYKYNLNSDIMYSPQAN